MTLSDGAWQRVYDGARADLAALPTLEVTEDYRIAPPRDGYYNVDLSPGWAGEIVSLWVPEVVEANVRDELPNGVRVPRTRLPAAAPATVCVHSRDGTRTVDLDRLELDNCYVQPMPDGQILVVGARCKYSVEAGAERNAALYDAGGALIRTGTLGDGIKAVRCTEAGDIWVGYFDEGVFGNNGWGASHGRAPIGSSGLVRFDATLQQVWECTLASLGWNPISDCYALELAGAEVWLCYYTDFNVARIREGEVSVWINETVAGARSLAVSGEHVGLIGGYLGEHDRIVIGRLADYKFHIESQARIVLPGGAELPQSYVAGGNGEITIVTDDGTVYRADFADWIGRR
jgi:hypothetical protein